MIYVSHSTRLVVIWWSFADECVFNNPQYCRAEIDRPAGPAAQLWVELLFHNCFEWESPVNLLRHADISVTITSLKKTLRGLVELMKPAIVERLHDLWPRQDTTEPTVPDAAFIQSVGHWLWNPTKINTVGQISTRGNEIYMINGEESGICLING